MKPHRQRIAIAKACGFKWSEYSDELGQLVAEFTPNYLNDLNAMHQAEMVLSRGEHYNQTGGFGRYKTALAEVCDEQHPIDATAAQRAEAFLRTIGKWEDDE
jgi:hypothetical protein